MQPIGLDLETAPNEGQPPEYALQPWRAREGLAKISLCAVSRTNGQSKTTPGFFPDLRSVLSELAGKHVATWSGVFDIAWLLAYGLEAEVRRIKWVDAMLLWKHYENGQLMELRPNWSLEAGAVRFLKGRVDWLEQFVALKQTDAIAGQNDKYWTLRGKMDALATAMIAEILWRKLTPKQQRLAVIEANTLVPVAKSWINGVTLDAAQAQILSPSITSEMQELERKLGLTTPPKTKKELREAREGWIPSKILASPKQLGNLLYSTWGLVCDRYTDKGAESSDKTALTYLADGEPRVLDILRWRELNTQRSKFIEGIAKSNEYLGTSITHPQPKLFSTYTGRMTYSTKSSSKGAGAKAKIGVALHQWPRPKALRSLVLAPEGKTLLEYDAAGQEARLMAIQSRDEAMLYIFGQPSPRDDQHSYTGARIGGYDFDEFLALKDQGVEAIVGSKGLRYCGKFNNLSQQYRVGAKKNRLVARVQYGLDIDLDTSKLWGRIYHNAYPGVRLYWRDAIDRAKALGYAETLGGRRFRLVLWDDDNKWGTESSAINFPIQGTGADMKELAITTLYLKYPEVDFMMDMHDGIFYTTNTCSATDELARDIRHTLNRLDYRTAWDFDPPIPLPWDGAIGDSWGAMRKVT